MAITERTAARLSRLSPHYEVRVCYSRETRTRWYSIGNMSATGWHQSAGFTDAQAAEAWLNTANINAAK